MLQGLTDLRDSATHVHFQKIIGTLVADVENGKLLSEALAAHPAVFGPVFVGLIRAGEQAGKLPEVFAKLTVTLKWQDELVAKTKRLLVYPLFVLCVVLARDFSYGLSGAADGDFSGESGAGVAAGNTAAHSAVASARWLLGMAAYLGIADRPARDNCA